MGSDVECCCICFEEYDSDRGRGVVLTACGHVFCKHCIVKWNDRRHTCPTCKQPLLLCVHPNASADACETPEYVCNFRFDYFGHVGITLKQRGDGGCIEVLRLNKKDAAFCAGVRNGDTLKFINGLACKRVQETIAIIEYAKDNKLNIECKFERRHMPRYKWIMRLW